MYVPEGTIMGIGQDWEEELRKVQLEDDIVGKVLRWLELGGEPQSYYWRIQSLNIFEGSRRIWLLELGYLNTNALFWVHTLPRPFCDESAETVTGI